MDPDQTLPATGMDSAPGDWSGRAVEIPRPLGRDTVLERLGSGATGVVFAAYDPQLDRRVAVKLLEWQGDEAGRQRLLEEARALAKLSHPNIVAVHDVEVAERGLETLQSSPEATGVDRAVVSLCLVRALHARSLAGDHARALALAREALAHFEAAGHDSRTTEAAQLEWMLRNTPTNSSP